MVAPTVMIPAKEVQPSTAVIPVAMAKDAIISWYRGEFAAANAIINALCGHFCTFEGGRCEYEAVFAAIHRRRLNWIPVLRMQKFFSIADVMKELQKVGGCEIWRLQKVDGGVGGDDAGLFQNENGLDLEQGR